MANWSRGKVRVGLVVLIATGVALLSLMTVGPTWFYDYFGAGNTIELRPSDLRYRLLISGSLLERVGRLEPRSEAIYHYSAQDGTAPETRGLRYSSAAAPAALLNYYRAACVAGAFGPAGTVAEQSSSYLLCRSEQTESIVRALRETGTSRVVIEVSELY